MVQRNTAPHEKEDMAAWVAAVVGSLQQRLPAYLFYLLGSGNSIQVESRVTYNKAPSQSPLSMVQAQRAKGSTTYQRSDTKQQVSQTLHCQAVRNISPFKPQHSVLASIKQTVFSLLPTSTSHSSVLFRAQSKFNQVTCSYYKTAEDKLLTSKWREGQSKKRLKSSTETLWLRGHSNSTYSGLGSPTVHSTHGSQYAHSFHPQYCETLCSQLKPSLQEGRNGS